MGDANVTDEPKPDGGFDAERYARKPPFPWFGGKSKAAPMVWRLLGDVEHYVEPFAGGLAVLLNRPHPCNRPYRSETVNDFDALLVNAWRGIQFAPDAVAEAASWPVTEACKSARQIALLRWRQTEAKERIAGDPRFFDAEMAGWWLWAVAVQIGAFSGDGAWTADPQTGCIMKMPRAACREPGVARSRLDLINNGRGVAGAALREPGVARSLPHLSDEGRGVASAALREPGVERGVPHLSNDGRGVASAALHEPGVADCDFPDSYDFHPITMPRLRWWMRLLSARLRHVRICNGDWARVCTTGALHTFRVRTGGICGVFLDPPYDNAERAKGLYSADDGSVAAVCRAWAIEAGKDPRTRIVLAGYDVEHGELERHGWTVHEWYTRDGLLAGGINKASGHRERLWASPHCLAPQRDDPQPCLFGGAL